MGGIDKHIRHYRTNHDTGERTLNTDFNLFVILNGVSYLAFLILVFTVGAFGGVSSTTKVLSYGYHTLVTVDELFFQLAWGFLIPWQGFWVVWQIANPAARNCEGVVRAAYFYPFAICVYAGYTISVRTGLLILGTIFCYGLCGTLVGLSMTMNKYRPKTLKDYMIWQGPLSLMASTVMIEAMLMTNAVFVRLDEIWIIKLVIAAASLLVIFLTAIAWLSSYPVDLLIPFVLGSAVGAMYMEFNTGYGHRVDLDRQGLSDENVVLGWKYSVLAVFSLILVAFICKVIVVLIHQRPRELAERRKTRESRVSVSITIDTGASNDNNNHKKSPKKSRNNSKKNRRPPLDEHYGNNDYDNSYSYNNNNNNNSSNINYTNNSWDIDSPPSTPVKKPKKKSSRNTNRDVSDPTSLSSTQSPVSVTPKKKKSTKKKKKKPRSPGGETSTTSYDHGDEDMV